MAKKRNRKTGAGSAPRSSGRGEATPSEILDLMLDVLEKSARKLQKRHAAGTVVAALTMGSLTAAKLLLRLQHGGMVFTGSPAVWELIEQASDDLAAENFEALFGGFEGESIPGLRLKGERHYLHLVRNRNGFRWCTTAIRPDEESPLEPGWATAVPPLAEDLTFALVECLAGLRSRLPQGARVQEIHALAETVALVALAKLQLAAWGNDRRAAAFETVADAASSRYAKTLASD
jgi:hypothetical protein